MKRSFGDTTIRTEPPGRSLQLFTRKRKNHTQLVYNCIAFATKTRQNQRPIAAMNNQTKPKKKYIKFWVTSRACFCVRLLFYFLLLTFYPTSPTHPLEELWPQDSNSGIFFFCFFSFLGFFFPTRFFSSSGVATIGGGEGLNERTDGLESEGLTLFRGRLDIFLALKHVIVPFLFVFSLAFFLSFYSVQLRRLCPRACGREEEEEEISAEMEELERWCGGCRERGRGRESCVIVRLMMNE